MPGMYDGVSEEHAHIVCVYRRKEQRDGKQEIFSAYGQLDVWQAYIALHSDETKASHDSGVSECLWVLLA